MSFLDESGLLRVWAKAKGKFVDKSTTINNKSLSSNIRLSYSDLDDLPDEQVIESYTILTSNWTQIVDSIPFTYECGISPQYEIKNTTVIELFMDQFQNILFATYGFSISRFDNETGKLYIQSIGLPDNSITFKIGFVG